MKKCIFLFTTLILCGLSYAQPKPENIAKIIHLDNDIYHWDWGNKPEHVNYEIKVIKFLNTEQYNIDTTADGNTDSLQTIGDELYDTDSDSLEVKYVWMRLATFVHDSLIPLLEIEQNTYDASDFKGYLDRIKHIETITWLDFVFRNVVRKSEINPRDTKYSTHQLKEMLFLINKRMEEIMADNISMYRFTETSKKWIRGVYVDHGNDFLSLASWYNDDRDMTGSFRIEIATDQFKMRVFDGYSNQKFNLNSRNFYSYQSIFFGGEGYTPYLRDTTIFNSSTAVDTNDRPYAAFQYVGRAKFRVSRHGKFRMMNQFKIGTIGSTRPGIIQSVIHRDVTIRSYTPNGWGAQIANGGRIGFSVEYYPEWMLTHLRSRNGINLSVFSELKYGTDMTSAGIGFGYSNKGFLQSGGINLPFVDRSSTTFKEFLRFNIIYTGRVSYRRVIHNSMLEGYGIIKHRIDEDPTSPIDVYHLQPDQMKRNVFISEFSLNIRFNYCGLVLKQVIMSPEYDLPVNSITYPVGEKGVISNHNTSSWNHYCTVGIFFLLK